MYKTIAHNLRPLNALVKNEERILCQDKTFLVKMSHSFI